jgi:leader peptidase (prepilin peptidase) / N-methyltransferase
MSLPAAALLLLVLAIASFTDLRSRIVPNALNLAGALAGLILAAFGGPGDVVLSAAAGLVLASPLLLVSLARPEGMGMGDVKLVAVLGIFLGWQAWPALLTGLFLAGLVGLTIALSTGSRSSGVALPLAPFLAVGTLPFVALAL